MLLTAFVALLLQAAPFWEQRPPAEWTRADVDRMMSDSPWAQTDGVRVYIASAEPVRQAELMWKKWRKQQLGVEGVFEEDEDYEQFLREHPGDYIVVGVYGMNPAITPEPRQIAQMEKQSRIKLDKRKYAMIAYFPPTPADPVLRMVFPKKLAGDEKKLILELYLPGVHLPYRNFEFPIKTLVWQGKPAL